jgi:hypothetical protein
MKIKSNRKKNLKEDEIVKKKINFLKISQIKQKTIKRMRTKSDRRKKLKDDEIEKKSNFINYFKYKK